MFYISNISGGQIPFDPRTTTIAKTAEAAQPVSSLPTFSEVSSTAALSPTTQAAVSSLATQSVESTSIADEATVYEGHALVAGRDPAGVGNSANLGRAGAVVAYQTQGGKPSEDETLSEAIRDVGTVQESRLIDDDDGASPYVVNPIKKKNYKYQPAIQEKKKVVVAADIMSTPVFSLRDSTLLTEAQRIFKERKFRHIPIVGSNGQLVGIISDRDFIGSVLHSGDTPGKISDRMVTDILTARPYTEIQAIAEVMINHHIGCLPITDDSQALVGILTRSDILRAIVNHAPIEMWT